MTTFSSRIRVFCLLLSAFCLPSAAGRADDAAPIALPQPPGSAAARTADEPPRWDAAVQAPGTLPPNIDAQPLSSAADIAPAAPRPLQSVMKNRPKQAAGVPAAVAGPISSTPAAPSEVNPARYEAIATAGNTSGQAASGAVPAAWNRSEPPADPAKIAAAHATADLLAGAVAELEAESIPRMSLAEALSGVPEQQRLAIVGKYWRLSRAIKDHRWAMDELKRLEAVAPNHNAVDGPMLSTARAAAEARVHDAELALVRAHESLAESAAPNLPTGGKPDFITGDRPLLGPYNTYFSAIFASRTPPGRTREIDRSLPIRLQSVADRTAAVQSAMSAVHTAEEAHAKGETDMRTVLACHEQLHAQRRALLDAVLDYNLDIAEYAAAVAAPGTPNDKFVAMLIHTRQPERLSQVPTLATDPSAPPSRASLDPTTFLGIRPNGTSEGPTVGLSTASGRNATTPQPQAHDGWVPSNLHSLEGEPPENSRPTQSSESSAPEGSRADPFTPQQRYREFGQ
jgi:hypothetical protein